MSPKVEMFNGKKGREWFIGVNWNERMSDQKLGACCNGNEFCLVAGGVTVKGEERDVIAIGRRDGTGYSVLNSVPLPFMVQKSPTVGKSAINARNAINRMKVFMAGEESELFREYLMEAERLGVAYEIG